MAVAPEVTVGLAVLFLFLVLPVAAVLHFLRRLRSGAAWRARLEAWAPELAVGLPEGRFSLRSGVDPRTSLPALEGAAGPRRVVLEPLVDLLGRICLRLRVQLRRPPGSGVTLAAGGLGALIRREPPSGSADFDRHFRVVSAGSPAGELMTEAVRSALVDFREVRRAPLAARVSGAWLELEEYGGPLTVDGWPEVAAALVALAQHLEAELPQDAPCILQVVDEALPAADAATCQVCGTPVGGTPVRCRSCGTPHHGDCWDYNGGCSTYACGCKEVSS